MAGRGDQNKQISKSPVTSAEDLIAHLSVAAGNVLDMPDVFSTVCRSMHRRYESCISVDGRSLDQLF